MATIRIEVPDNDILKHLEKYRHLVTGDIVGGPIVEIADTPPTANTRLRHEVVVTLRYALSDEEINSISGR